MDNISVCGGTHLFIRSSVDGHLGGFHLLAVVNHASVNINFRAFGVVFFLAALGLRCYVRAFSSCGEWGLVFVAVRGLLIVVASLVAEHRL